MSKISSPFNDEQLTQVNQIVDNHSSEQLAWLSGYLWGIVTKNTQSEISSAAQLNLLESQPKPTIITIISASQTGNARRVAQELSHDIERLGYQVNHIHAGDYKFKQIAKESHLIIVTSTQGEGEPPEEALPFYQYLFSKKAPKLEQLSFAVLGLGDASYVNFCQAGKDFDKRLHELGANRLLERADLDTDYQSASEQWRQNMIDKLSKCIECQSQAVVPIDTGNIIVESSLYTRDNPFIATVNVNQKITARDSDKEVRHIELDLSDSKIRYQAGDSVGVWYENSPQLVDELLSYLNADPLTEIELNGQPFPLRQALLEKLELTQNTPVIVENYAKAINHPELLALTNDKTALRDFSQQIPIVDMLRRYPAKIEIQQFVQILRPLTPRFYSIASAQDEVDEEVHLTVNIVRYTVDGKERLGGASGFLAQQKPDEGKVKLFIERNDNFRLPEDSTLPIIMIAAGTGIAPFRAFMQQRASEPATGESWLIFGNPHFRSDFLYQLEWQRYIKEGTLTRIDLAWSRDQAEKTYVQHRLVEQAKEVWTWLQKGAYIYVCGDANRMAKAVNEALLQVIIEQGQYDQEQANDYLNELRINKRYQRDIY